MAPVAPRSLSKITGHGDFLVSGGTLISGPLGVFSMADFH